MKTWEGMYPQALRFVLTIALMGKVSPQWLALKQMDDWVRDGVCQPRKESTTDEWLMQGDRKFYLAFKSLFDEYIPMKKSPQEPKN